MANAVTRYSDADLIEFEALIHKKLQKANEQLESMHQQILEITENASDEYGGDWVDDSSTNSEVEMLNNMAIRQRMYIRDLENALIRIKNKTYGICSVTGELIDKKRLMAVPTTTKSLSAKMGTPQEEPEKKPERPAPRPMESGPKVITKIIRKPTPPAPPKPKVRTEEDDDDLELEKDFFFDEEEIIPEDSMLDLEEIADDDQEEDNDLDLDPDTETEDEEDEEDED